MSEVYTISDKRFFRKISSKYTRVAPRSPLHILHYTQHDILYIRFCLGLNRASEGSGPLRLLRPKVPHFRLGNTCKMQGKRRKMQRKSKKKEAWKRLESANICEILQNICEILRKSAKSAKFCKTVAKISENLQKSANHLRTWAKICERIWRICKHLRKAVNI